MGTMENITKKRVEEFLNALEKSTGTQEWHNHLSTVEAFISESRETEQESLTTQFGYIWTELIKIRNALEELDQDIVSFFDDVSI